MAQTLTMEDELELVTTDTRKLTQRAASRDFVRYLACVLERGSPEAASALFLERWPRAMYRSVITDAAAKWWTKAATAPGSTTDPAWGGALVGTTPYVGFLALVRSAELLGRIPGLVKVPFYVRVPRQTAGAACYWVPQGAPKPLAKLTFDPGITLTPTKAATIFVVSKELARLTVPGTEDQLVRELVDNVAAYTDAQLLDPAVVAVAGTNPASITHGLTPIAPSGDLDTDIGAALGALFAARPGASGAVLLVSSATCAAIAGTGKNPNTTLAGGFAHGAPLIATEAAGTMIVALDPAGLVVADAGVDVNQSKDGTIIMTDGPLGTGADIPTSLWQNNLVALKGERAVNWQAVPGAVAYVGV